MSRRERFARMFDRSGMLDALVKVRCRASIPWLTVLTYHQFPGSVHDPPFDEGVVDVTPEAFERQVAFLKKHFSVIGVDELCAHASGRPLPKNPVAIAFDDGYRSNAATALPILEKYGAKAIFFVPTAFIDERKIHWWDRIAYLIKMSPARQITLEYPTRVTFLLTLRQIAIRRVLALVKQSPSLDLDRFLMELGRAARVPWCPRAERRFADRLLVTWDDLRALRKAGMDVQSHTRTHRVLQTLPDAELADELEGSREDLKRELGEHAVAVAYPVGHPLPPSSPIRTAMTKAGYEIGLTNATGPIPLFDPPDRFNLPRQSVDRDLSHSFFMTMLTLPELAPAYPWHLREKDSEPRCRRPG